MKQLKLRLAFLQRPQAQAFLSTSVGLSDGNPKSRDAHVPHTHIVTTHIVAYWPTDKHRSSDSWNDLLLKSQQHSVQETQGPPVIQKAGVACAKQARPTISTVQRDQAKAFYPSISFWASRDENRHLSTS